MFAAENGGFAARGFRLRSKFVAIKRPPPERDERRRVKDVQFSNFVARRGDVPRNVEKGGAALLALSV
jgi:hypothetical protein